MVVMSIGITAIVAGYSSAILAVNRSKSATTAAAAADQTMEMYRQGGYAAVPTTTVTPPPPPGYWLQVEGSLTCAIGMPDTAGACPGPPANRWVKFVKITVRDGSSAGKLLFTESATFDRSTG